MKPIDILGIIVSIIALIGSLSAMYVLLQLGGAITQFTATGSQLGPAAAEGITQFVQIMQTFMTLCWIWSIAVFLSSLYGIWSALQKGKKK